MSKAYEMISESLNEIIQDLEETGGKNLNREIISHKQADEKISEKKTTLNMENFFEGGADAEAV